MRNHSFGSKLRRTSNVAAPPVSLQQRTCLRTGRDSRSVPITDMQGRAFQDRRACLTTTVSPAAANTVEISSRSSLLVRKLKGQRDLQQPGAVAGLRSGWHCNRRIALALSAARRAEAPWRSCRRAGPSTRRPRAKGQTRAPSKRLRNRGLMPPTWTRRCRRRVAMRPPAAPHSCHLFSLDSPSTALGSFSPGSHLNLTLVAVDISMGWSRIGPAALSTCGRRSKWCPLTLI
jgi:hypothetical protein